MSMPTIETVITIDELVPNGSNSRRKVQVKLYSVYLFVMHSFGQCGLVGTEHGLLS